MPTGSIRDVSDELRCPAGHTGPFRYVEAIEVWREVQTATTDEVVVEADWQTGEGYNEGVPVPEKCVITLAKSVRSLLKSPRRRGGDLRL